jgi:hypothetical protein
MFMSYASPQGGLCDRVSSSLMIDLDGLRRPRGSVTFTFIFKSFSRRSYPELNPSRTISAIEQAILVLEHCWMKSGSVGYFQRCVTHHLLNQVSVSLFQLTWGCVLDMVSPLSYCRQCWFTSAGIG